MKELLLTIARGLVENPDAVTVEQDEPAEDGTVVFHLRVAPDDMGRVIGKQGRIAKAMPHRDACRRNPPGYQGWPSRSTDPAGLAEEALRFTARRPLCTEQSKRGTNHAAKTVS